MLNQETQKEMYFMFKINNINTRKQTNKPGLVATSCVCSDVPLSSTKLIISDTIPKY